MIDTELKLSKVLDLLIQQTESGKLAWQESYRNSFQATLSGQTVVVKNEGFPSLGTPEPVLEIRDSKGELVQRIGSNFNPMSGIDIFDRKIRTDPTLLNKVQRLVVLLESREDFKLSKTLDNILKELEK